MNKRPYPTAKELAAEAREALAHRPKRTPEEEFTLMIRRGFINSKGEVTRLIGGSAEPEPDYQNWTPDDGEKQKKKKKKRAE